MIVAVDPTQAGYAVRLEQPEDFEGFKVVARGLRREELAEALRAVGELDGDGDAYIRIDAVKELAPDHAREPAWLASFDRMVEFASSHGWISPDGRSIRAHCELERPAG